MREREVNRASNATDRPAILVVDGDRRVRTALCRLLAATDDLWTVTAVADPAAAAEHVLRAAPDVVLVDVTALHADPGLALIGRLHDQGLAVVALSAADGKRSAALRHGASAFLPKDAPADTVVHVVRQSVRQSVRAAHRGPPTPRSP